jgi:hypothetical protein
MVFQLSTASSGSVLGMGDKPGVTSILDPRAFFRIDLVFVE